MTDRIKSFAIKDSGNVCHSFSDAKWCEGDFVLDDEVSYLTMNHEKEKSCSFQSDFAQKLSKGVS